jgi:hypothetical protein
MTPTVLALIGGGLALLGSLSGAIEKNAKPGSTVYRVATFLASVLPDATNMLGAFKGGGAS